MTLYQRIWSDARNRLARSAAALGYPEELADLLAGELGSPKAIDRMASYLNQARPGPLELIVDEMLAIRAEIGAWRERKESRTAQAEYSAWLRSGERLEKARDPDA